MAQTKRKTTSTRKTSSAAKPTPRRQTVSRANAVPRQPHRREVAAAVCLLLGVFSFIGYFDSEPLFISFFTGFVKRFIGYGFYALPPALFMCAVILAFHKGYPVLLRTISTLSLTAVVGALVHVVWIVFPRSDNQGILSLSMFVDLWRDGAALASGGVISGGITELFVALFGGIGTLITLIIIAAVLVLISFNATVSGIIGAFSNREKLYYDREELPVNNGVYDAENEELRERDNHKHRYPLFPFRKKKPIDIPLDDRRPPKKDFFSESDPLNAIRNAPPYNPTPRVKTPDEVLKDAEASNDVGDAEESQNLPTANSAEAYQNPEDFDMPFDIPFIDEKWRASTAPPPVVPPIQEERFITAQDNFAPDTILPPVVMEQVTKPKKRKMPSVPEPEGADGNISAVLDANLHEADESFYTFPPLDLLSKGDRSSGSSRAGESEVSQNSERLEAAFQSFGINVNITNTTRGPSVTRYEAELEAGIKLSRLTGLADDIALALGTVGVRIAAMPNKISTVGIEVPNKSISRVHLRDVIESSAFQESKSKLTFAIGMDISGAPIVGEISKLPHMLVAGTTGSGKSVCLNSIILSILYKSSPKDVRFIMLDPKMVEFKVYNNIPHLLVPVVTDVKKAAGALQWATFEMMKRYNMFSETNARDIEGYNKFAQKSNEEHEPLPQVVVIIDELADLMMMAAKEVEESVCRIAQMGRAAGIHLIIATQSPRANVITGLMKANIPSRIAFKVASALESQIILDPGQNADKLVGNGDMLYSPIGAAKPMRLQGTWVSDKERERVVEFIKSSGDTQYSEEVMFEIDKAASDKSSGGASGGADADSEHDELLPQAVDVIFETGQASVSMLQRRLKLGYARAARIVDQMEELGIVGQYEGSKPRTLLITRDQWRQMQYISGVAPVDRPNGDDFPIASSVSDEN